MSQEIVSAGIDIGTSTTHLSISKLTIQNVSAGSRVPRLSVTDRKVLYQSRIYTTPLKEDSSIDADAVRKIIEIEYDKAGLQFKDIQTGALIITGESARQRNAREVSHAMAHLAGDFVVASAGPHLESLLAGRGSGAEHASRTQRKTICNIDIGGGTCNYAVFQNGNFLDSACLGIGGRCIQFDEAGKISRFTESGETFLDGVAKLHLLRAGTIPDEELLDLIASLISELILHAATRKTPPQIVQRLMQTDALRHDYEIDEFWISGGVAECMQEIFTSGGVAECIEISTSGGVAERRQENSAGGNNASSADRFGDMGVRIAKALPGAFCDRNLQYRIGEQAIRATVIGAGMHSMQLSGSTIWVSRDRLPLRNVQILRPFVDTRAELSAAQIKESIKAILANFRLDESASSFAIELCDLSRLSYSALQTWAAVFAEMFGSESQIAAVKESGNTSSSAVAQEPLILLSREDIGMALGQSIHKYAPELELIVLDGIDTAYGDYLDIGRPLANQEAIPLTVKTLIFRQD